MKIVCQYALLRFRPFVETGEFANVGVVLMAPSSRYFGFRLLKRYARITQFFPELDRKIYLGSRAIFEQELERFGTELRRAAFAEPGDAGKTALAANLFAELARPRDALLQFDEARVALADDPQTKLDVLFDYYVERNFVTKEYQERLLEGAIRKLLVRAEMAGRYRQAKIGNEDFAVSFPFVRTGLERIEQVIKPLYLGQAQSTKVLTHGGQWVDRVRRLRKRQALPSQVMFTVAPPQQTDTAAYAAFEEIRDDLRDAAVTVVLENDESAILDFAKR